MLNYDLSEEEQCEILNEPRLLPSRTVGVRLLR